MGSSHLDNIACSPNTHIDIPFTALHNISATCNVTNKIDINKYFEVFRNEYAKQESPTTLHKEYKRSDSSGSLPTSRRKMRSTSNKLRKRVSTGDISRAGFSELDKSRKSEYYNYELSSGQVVDINDNCVVSRQKSWDLSVSRMKSHRHHHSNDENSQSLKLALSYSEGDFKKVLNNKKLSNSKSCESISLGNDLHKRHHEHAMMHGKLGSVSEQNRKIRRKYYKKKKSFGDKIGPPKDESHNICDNQIIADFNNININS